MKWQMEFLLQFKNTQFVSNYFKIVNLEIQNLALKF